MERSKRQTSRPVVVAQSPEEVGFLVRATGGPPVSQIPTLLRLPSHAVDFERSQLALEFAVDAGFVLDDWQQFLVWHSNSRDEHGDLAAKTCYGEVTRQSGKNLWLEIDQLTGLLLFGYNLFIHSAYRADTVHEHFLSMQEHILDSPLLCEFIKPTGNRGFFSANGKEAIEFANGARLLFKTRSKQAGRGARPQKLYYDECLILDQETVDAQVPSIVAQPGNQVVYASSAPLAESTVQHNLRSRAMSADDDTDVRFFAMAWNNDIDVDIDDPVAQTRVNPSLGQGRMTLESLNENRRNMSLAGFVREHLGVPDEPSGSARSEIDGEVWRNLGVRSSEVETGKAWGIAISDDGQWATIGVAGLRADGKIHVEWKSRRPGTNWVVPEALLAYGALGVPVRIQATGPEGSLIDELEKAGVEVEKLPTAEMAKATGRFIRAVHSQNLCHLGQATLNDQIEIARTRRTTEGAKIWHRRTETDAPVDALIAVTAALSGVYDVEPEVEEDWFAY